MPFGIGVPNFIEIGTSAAKLSYDIISIFQDAAVRHVGLVCGNGRPSVYEV